MDDVAIECRDCTRRKLSSAITGSKAHRSGKHVQRDRSFGPMFWQASALFQEHQQDVECVVLDQASRQAICGRPLRSRFQMGDFIHDIKREHPALAGAKRLSDGLFAHDITSVLSRIYRPGARVHRVHLNAAANVSSNHRVSPGLIGLRARCGWASRRSDACAPARAYLRWHSRHPNGSTLDPRWPSRSFAARAQIQPGADRLGFRANFSSRFAQESAIPRGAPSGSDSVPTNTNLTFAPIAQSVALKPSLIVIRVRDAGRGMRIAKQLALIAAGYGLSVGGAIAAVAVNERLIPDAVKQSSGGMVAFGDMILFVLVAGFLSLAPTWFLLKLCVEKAPRTLLAAELLIAAIGPASWLTVR